MSDTNERIPVCSALLDGNEKQYLEQCIATSWVSSSGPFVKQFEQAFADYLGSRFAVTTSSGTSSLHLALLALGVKPGDEVIVPSLTMIASGNAILYTGATPVIVDVDSTGNMDPQQVGAAITTRTRAVLPVHLYGLACNMSAILDLCAARGIPIVEDAAEAVGTTYGGRRAGAIGAIGCFSFFANKVLTTGEGGMLVTDDEGLAAAARSFKDQCFVPERRFYHPDVGYNYRMTNLQAAVGLAQIERVEQLAAARTTVARNYRELLAGIDSLELPPEAGPDGLNAHWMYAVRLRGRAAHRRDALATYLRSKNIDTRSFFVPLNRQPAFASFSAVCPVADDLSGRGLLLPTGPTLTPQQQERVAQELTSFLL